MPALAALLACTVIGIADGDTVTARCDAVEGKANVVVRTLMRQKRVRRGVSAAGSTCRRCALEKLLFSRSARLIVMCAWSRTLNAMGWMRAKSMAMVFDRHVRDAKLYGVQDEARTAQRGLWGEREHVPPWEFRRSPQKIILMD
jgi:hypothetical protein